MPRATTHVKIDRAPVPEWYGPAVGSHCTPFRPADHPMSITCRRIVVWKVVASVGIQMLGRRPRQINKTLRPNLAHRHPNVQMYQRDASLEEIKGWVHHSKDNLWVLCDVRVGIHEISYPMWIPQDLTTDGYVDVGSRPRIPWYQPQLSPGRL